MFQLVLSLETGTSKRNDMNLCPSPAALSSLIPLRRHTAHNTKSDFSLSKYVPIFHSFWLLNTSQLPDPAFNEERVIYPKSERKTNGGVGHL